MGDPDWGRVKVVLGPVGPLGDSTRWGAQVPTPLPATFNTIFSQQIVAAQTRDGYARSWGIVGALSLPLEMWLEPAPQLAAGVLPPVFPIVVALEITMGVGQGAVVHQIMLTMGQNATIGVCNTQNAVYGGPYLSSFDRFASGGGSTQRESRPFAAIGAFVGNNISIRARYVWGNSVFLPTTSVLSIALTPFAAGTGL